MELIFGAFISLSKNIFRFHCCYNFLIITCIYFSPKYNSMSSISHLTNDRTRHYRATSICCSWIMISLLMIRFMALKLSKKSKNSHWHYSLTVDLKLMTKCSITNTEKNVWKNALKIFGMCVGGLLQILLKDLG